MRARAYIFFIFFFLSASCFSQVTKFQIRESINKSIAVEHSTIEVEGRQYYSDRYGNFSINNLGSDALFTVSKDGYEPYSGILTNPLLTDTTITVFLQKSIREYRLEEVMVSVKKKDAFSKAPLVSDYISKEEFIGLPSTIELLDKISGIKVRKDGETGSKLNFSVAGMTGKHVKVFLDGIPIDAFGNSFSMNSIQMTNLSGIEVYKGVLPSSLSADALGGAINFVEKQERKGNLLSTNYSVGSFGNHNFYLKTQLNKKSFYIGGDLNLVYAKNNYTINADVLTKEGVMQNEEVSLFHNRYRNYFVRGKIGLAPNMFSDKFELIPYCSTTHKEIQSDALSRQPYASVEMNEANIGALLQYRKRLAENINFTLYSLYSVSRTTALDTLQQIYNWRGEVIAQSPGRGEITNRGLNALYRLRNLTLQETMKWYINDRLSLSEAIYFSTYKRTSKDNFTETTSEFRVNPFPQYTTKFISSVEANYSPTNNITMTSAIKLFSFSTKGHITDDNGEHVLMKKDNIHPGYNLGITYFPNKSLLLKLSYEHALRIPTVEELFGDNVLVTPNLDLRPEMSDNVNLSLIFKRSMFSIEPTFFFRNVHDIIWQKTGLNTLTSMNLSNTRIMGFDILMSMKPIKSLELLANATYQDLRNLTTKFESNRYDNLRVPNIPYFFGNIDLRYTNKRWLRHYSASFSAWLTNNYTHEFFLFWANDGKKSEKNTIPTQFITNIGCSVGVKKLSCALEVRNVLDKVTFDNFKKQKPGRAFTIQINYTL